MIASSHRQGFWSLEYALLLALVMATLGRAFAQQHGGDDPETAAMRKQALEFYQAGKFVEAMPLLGKLSARNPEDFVVKEHWAYSMLEYSATLSDPNERKRQRMHARELALEAQKAGDQSDLMQLLLSIPPDGSEPKFSERKDVDDAMRSAEASFARGDYDSARAGYQRALDLDPKNYEAAVFTGDAYFKQKIYDRAGEWFQRAIDINPDKEAAYRYWGDALAMAGKNDEARQKYINAVIAEPYNRAPWAALRTWTDRTNQPFNAIILENKSSTKKAGDKAVSLDEHSLAAQSPEAAGWAAYEKTRQTWKEGRFKKEYPGESNYRHSLKEETEALDAMVAVLAPDAASMKKAEILDPSLLALIRLDHDGLLEPFVLLNRADPEIAKDYPAYLKAHRDRLYRYVDEVVLPRGGNQAAK
ncbi:MAG TPA: tetratricopeptide repeat protein [Terriglobales bacterium]|nr:tetratricopeptide repeat protein [Terriglobales bacterium]